jgi:hypothetical protein
MIKAETLAGDDVEIWRTDLTGRRPFAGIVFPKVGGHFCCTWEPDGTFAPDEKDRPHSLNLVGSKRSVPFQIGATS